MLISIIIPLYNEERTINNVINRIPDNYSFEIIVVDDGSTDHSIQKVKEIKNKNINLIKHYKNLGYGASILTGIQNSQGDIIVTIDSDGQHNPEEIPLLIKPIINKKADIVIGSRYIGKSRYKVPLHTRVGEAIISMSLWFLFNQRIGNNQCGFRAFSKKSSKIFHNLLHTNFGFCTESLFKARYYKFKILEVPITINRRIYGRSYVSLFAIIKSVIFCITIYFLKKIKIKKIVPKRVIYKLYPVIKSNLKKFV